MSNIEPKTSTKIIQKDMNTLASQTKNFMKALNENLKEFKDEGWNVEIKVIDGCQIAITVSTTINKVHKL